MQHLAKKSINYIMDEFDFDRVHKAMMALNWQWYFIDGIYAIPTIEDLRYKAEQLLLDAISTLEKNYYVATGGFVVRKEDNNFISLSFELTDCDNGDMLKREGF